MQGNWRKLAVLLALATTTMGATCLNLTSPFVISVNIKGITGTHNVTPGTVSFDPSCSTYDPAQYIDPQYNIIGQGRLVDVSVQTVGTFNANVVGGQATINGQTLVTYAGSWNFFNTERSILLDPATLQRNPAGVNALLTAVQNQQPITICHAGQFTSAAPAGLQVIVKVFAQVNAGP